MTDKTPTSRPAARPRSSTRRTGAAAADGNGHRDQAATDTGRADLVGAADDPQPCAGCGDGGTVQLDDQAPAVAPCDGCADRQARLFFWIGAAFGTALCGLAVGIWAWTVARRLARPPDTGQETGPDD